MDDRELEHLLQDIESDRVERKESLSDGERIHQAICAFANDLPNHQRPGVVFVGAADDGSGVGLPITDELLRALSDVREHLLPWPAMTVEKRRLRGCDMAVIVVEPADAPPVRYKGVVWIRVGPRRARATSQEERILAEKRRSKDLPFDLRLWTSASLDDLDLELFRRVYIPCAVSPDVIEENDRSLEQQLAALRFATSGTPMYPTVTGLLTIGKMPSDSIPGAYVQFLRLDGLALTDPIKNEHALRGPLLDILPRLDDLLEINITSAVDVTSGATDIRRPDYPIVALQQLARNAIMHRDYEGSNAPVRITWFQDRVEIQNPGGPYGQVTRANFGTPGITDYRNPHVAEAMKNLGYVQRFGVGIPLARRELAKNGSPDPEFVVEDNHVLVVVRSRT